MADLASKQAEAEQLREELRALRVQRESAAQEGHNKVLEQQVDAELEALRGQIEQEKAALQSTGSVDDAKAAMAAAAAAAATETSSPVASDKVDPALLPSLLVGEKQEK